MEAEGAIKLEDKKIQTSLFKDKLSKLYTLLKRGIESKYYIYFIGLACLFFSFLNLDMAGFIFFVLLFAFIMCTNINIKCVVPIIIMIVYVMSIKNSPILDAAYYLKTSSLAIMSVAGSVLILSCVFGIIKRKLKIEFSVNLLSNIGICIAFVFGGIFYRNYHAGSMLIGLILTLCFLGSFVFFKFFIKKIDFLYIAKTILVASMVVVLELAFFYLTSNEMLKTFEKSILILGWGISNAIAIMIVTGMPFAIYFMTKSKYPLIYFGILLLQIIAVVFTYSRAALLVAFPIVAVGFIYSLFVTKGKAFLQILIAGIVAALAVGLVVIFKWDSLVNMMGHFVEFGFDDNGREELVQEAFEKFISAPFLGVGAYESIKKAETFIFFYHNTFLQFLAWSGTVGILFYVLHLSTIFICFVKRPNFERVILGVVIFAAFAHSMLDCVIYYPYLTFIYMLCIAAVEDDFLRSNSLTGFLKKV